MSDIHERALRPPRMKQLTYKATVDGGTLVVRSAGTGFETVDPTEALLDDPPRCPGAAGAHAWCAVVLAWRRRGDERIGWRRDLVREVVSDARQRWKHGAEEHQRLPIHVFQDEATRRAEEHYAPPQQARQAAHASIPPALRGAVLHPPQQRRGLR